MANPIDGPTRDQFAHALAMGGLTHAAAAEVAQNVAAIDGHGESVSQADIDRFLRGATGNRVIATFVDNGQTYKVFAAAIREPLLRAFALAQGTAPQNSASQTSSPGPAIQPERKAPPTVGSRVSREAFTAELLKQGVDPDLALRMAHQISGLDGDDFTVSDQDLDRLANGARQGLPIVVAPTKGGLGAASASSALHPARQAFRQALSARDRFNAQALAQPEQAFTALRANPRMLNQMTIQAAVSLACFTASRPSDAAFLADSLRRLLSVAPAGVRLTTHGIAEALSHLPPAALATTSFTREQRASLLSASQGLLTRPGSELSTEDEQRLIRFREALASR